MLSDGSQITLAARLAAIEYMLGHLFRVVYRSVGATPEMIEESFQKFREQLKKETFSGPGIQPAQSDMIAGEMEEAFDHLLGVISDVLGTAKKK